MEYFTELPLLVYPNLEVDNSTTYVSMTNILTRSAFLKEIVENTALFYDYQVKDGETPEMIADKLYGDPKRFWIVMLFNTIMNPYYDFPLVSEQLNALIESKYGITPEQAQDQIHHYEERIKRTTYYNGMPQSTTESRVTVSATYADPVTGIAVARPYLPNEADTSLAGPSYTENFGSGVTVTVEYSYHAISTYTYEYEENEKRRSIRLIDANYVGVIESEFRRLMRNGN